MRALITILAFLLLAGCGTDLSQEAKTATLTYTAATKAAQSVLKADILPAKTEACIKVADNIAFNYQDQMNQKAQDWIDAGSDDKTAIEKAFENIETVFNASMASLTNLITGKGVC